MATLSALKELTLWLWSLRVTKIKIKTMCYIVIGVRERTDANPKGSEGNVK